MRKQPRFLGIKGLVVTLIAHTLTLRERKLSIFPVPSRLAFVVRVASRWRSHRLCFSVFVTAFIIFFVNA